MRVAGMQNIAMRFPTNNKRFLEVLLKDCALVHHSHTRSSNPAIKGSVKQMKAIRGWHVLYVKAVSFRRKRHRNQIVNFNHNRNPRSNLTITLYGYNPNTGYLNHVRASRCNLWTLLRFVQRDLT